MKTKELQDRLKQVKAENKKLKEHIQGNKPKLEIKSKVKRKS